MGLTEQELYAKVGKGSISFSDGTNDLYFLKQERVFLNFKRFVFKDATGSALFTISCKVHILSPSYSIKTVAGVEIGCIRRRHRWSSLSYNAMKRKVEHMRCLPRLPNDAYTYDVKSGLRKLAIIRRRWSEANSELIGESSDYMISFATDDFHDRCLIISLAAVLEFERFSRQKMH